MGSTNDGGSSGSEPRHLGLGGQQRVADKPGQHRGRSAVDLPRRTEVVGLGEEAPAHVEEHADKLTVVRVDLLRKRLDVEDRAVAPPRPGRPLRAEVAELLLPRSHPVAGGRGAKRRRDCIKQDRRRDLPGAVSARRRDVLEDLEQTVRCRHRRPFPDPGRAAGAARRALAAR